MSKIKSLDFFCLSSHSVREIPGLAAAEGRPEHHVGDAGGLLDLEEGRQLNPASTVMKYQTMF